MAGGIAAVLGNASPTIFDAMADSEEHADMLRHNYENDVRQESATRNRNR